MFHRKWADFLGHASYFLYVFMFLYSGLVTTHASGRKWLLDNNTGKRVCCVELKNVITHWIQ